jgi:hypothetical protein
MKRLQNSKDAVSKTKAARTYKKDVGAPEILFTSLAAQGIFFTFGCTMNEKVVCTEDTLYAHYL